ncbi:Ig-like domain-containing protein [Tropicibacter naphthalenivorans]|uniref:VCBS repeat n=1 Tax=Tropicibacter naphthalenivorans TaxID=441103 RepID=A0A0P1GFA8_9RHOB|nr:Ig-like domain-containing protein [Tropicibacter naphthalenivorans]CUH74980.1 VCBS repeat [Tropicibacter naphthalenivorans]SMC47645.1 VCBS repeat-containing protein [Tropicibacter naphthalenivorans]
MASGDALVTDFGLLAGADLVQIDRRFVEQTEDAVDGLSPVVVRVELLSGGQVLGEGAFARDTAGAADAWSATINLTDLDRSTLDADAPVQLRILNETAPDAVTPVVLRVDDVSSPDARDPQAVAFGSVTLDAALSVGQAIEALTLTVAANDYGLDAAAFEGAVSLFVQGYTLEWAVTVDKAALAALPQGADLAVGFDLVLTDGATELASLPVAVQITAQNDAPEASEGSALLDEDTPFSGQLLATDVDGDALHFALQGAPAKCTVEIDPDSGAFTYTPLADAVGADTFSFTATDPQGGVSAGMVTLDITPVNDAPSLISGAVSDGQFALRAGETVTLYLGTYQFTDSDGAGSDMQLRFDGYADYTVVWTGVGAAQIIDARGVTDEVSNVDRLVFDDYEMRLDGQDNAPYAGLAQLAVTAGTPAQIDAAALLGDSFDPDGAAVSLGAVASENGIDAALSGETLTLQAGAALDGLAEGQSADVTVTATVTSGGASVTAPVTVTVTGINDAPVAAADAAQTTSDTAVLAELLANDSDVDAGAVLSVTGIEGGTWLRGAFVATTAHGATVSVTRDAQVTYDPRGGFDSLAAGETAVDALSYTVTDEHGASATETLTLTVTGADAPVPGPNDYADYARRGFVIGSEGGLLTARDIQRGSEITAVKGARPPPFRTSSMAKWSPARRSWWMAARAASS